MAAAGILSLSASAVAYASPVADPLFEYGVSIHDARVLPSPRGGRMGAGYMTVAAPRGDAIIGVEAAFGIELHESLEDDAGVVRMTRRDRIEIPAGTEVVFEPGGLHVMLIGVDPPMKVGDEVSITLTFEKAGEVEILFPVEDRAGPDGHSDHGG